MSRPILQGLHHVTAVTANARLNLDFYTRVLGLRLVKKTVNQDDLSAYHLFYADDCGQPGTEFTFFEWNHVPPNQPGTGMVIETALRVRGGADTLTEWAAHLDTHGVAHGAVENWAGRASLSFRDPEGQHLRLVTEPEGEGDGLRTIAPWQGSPLPAEQSIIGLGAVTLAVRDVEPAARLLTDVLGFQQNASDSTLYEVNGGGPGRFLRLVASNVAGSHGAGGVHHVAWSVADREAQNRWIEHLREHRVPNSGLVDRFYFRSLYFRIPGGILFEIATDGPGFTADGEDAAHLGERLSLPPFLEPQRTAIERGLRPLINP